MKKLPDTMKLKTPCCGKTVRIPLYKFATYLGYRTCFCKIKWIIKAEVLIAKENFGIVHEISWSLDPDTKVAGTIKDDLVTYN